MQYTLPYTRLPCTQNSLKNWFTNVQIALKSPDALKPAAPAAGPAPPSPAVASTDADAAPAATAANGGGAAMAASDTLKPPTDQVLTVTAAFARLLIPREFPTDLTLRPHCTTPCTRCWCTRASWTPI